MTVQRNNSCPYDRDVEVKSGGYYAAVSLQVFRASFSSLLLFTKHLQDLIIGINVHMCKPLHLNEQSSLMTLWLLFEQ